MVSQQQKTVGAVPLLALGQPVGAQPFRDDDDAHLGPVAEPFGEAQQKRGIVLKAERPRVKHAQFVGEAVLARPGVVLRARGKLADRRPVLDDVKLAFGHAPIREYRQKILSDDNHGVAAPGQPPFETLVMAPDEVPEDRKAEAKNHINGNSVHFLNQEHKARASGNTLILQNCQSIQRRLCGDDDIRLPGLDPRRQQTAESPLLAPACEEVVLAERRIEREPVDLEARGVIDPPCERPLGRLERGRVKVKDAVAAPRQFAAQLDRKSVSRMVVDEDFQGAVLPGGVTGNDIARRAHRPCPWPPTPIC